MRDPIKLSDISGGPAAGDVLCLVKDIADGQAKEFSWRQGNDLHEIFIQRLGDDIHAFVNICPHAGGPLNMDDGKFMEKTGRYLMCHTHGALFDPKSGQCLAGPCNGAFLRAVALEIKEGEIRVL